MPRRCAIALRGTTLYATKNRFAGRAVHEIGRVVAEALSGSPWPRSPAEDQRGIGSGFFSSGGRLHRSICSSIEPNDGAVEFRRANGSGTHDPGAQRKWRWPARVLARRSRSEAIDEVETAIRRALRSRRGAMASAPIVPTRMDCRRSPRSQPARQPAEARRRRLLGAPRDSTGAADDDQKDSARAAASRSRSRPGLQDEICGLRARSAVFKPP